MNTASAVLMFVIGAACLAFGCYLVFGTKHGELACIPCIASGFIAIASGISHLEKHHAR